jgi:predicted metal-dependent HD superfamily phosphohydrolase
MEKTILEMDNKQWRSSWEKLNLCLPEGDDFDVLLKNYSASNRKYHTLQHLKECFEHLAEIESHAERLGEIELAIWFHDIVYDAKRHDNESKSAEWASKCLVRVNAPVDISQRIETLILSTAKHGTPTTIDTAILSDCDLWILGSPVDRFEQYEHQIREEYKHVPSPIFKFKRQQLLRKFLNREKIFNTQHFHAKYEAKARKNMRL